MSTNTFTIKRNGKTDLIATYKPVLKARAWDAIGSLDKYFER